MANLPADPIREDRRSRYDYNSCSCKQELSYPESEPISTANNIVEQKNHKTFWFEIIDIKGTVYKTIKAKCTHFFLRSKDKYIENYHPNVKNISLEFVYPFSSNEIDYCLVGDSIRFTFYDNEKIVFDSAKIDLWRRSPKHNDKYAGVLFEVLSRTDHLDKTVIIFVDTKSQTVYKRALGKSEITRLQKGDFFGFSFFAEDFKPPIDPKTTDFGK